MQNINGAACNSFIQRCILHRGQAPVCLAEAGTSWDLLSFGHTWYERRENGRTVHRLWGKFWLHFCCCCSAAQGRLGTCHIGQLHILCTLHHCSGVSLSIRAWRKAGEVGEWTPLPPYWSLWGINSDAQWWYLHMPTLTLSLLSFWVARMGRGCELVADTG